MLQVRGIRKRPTMPYTPNTRCGYQKHDVGLLS